MSKPLSYDATTTGILLVDLYNDFISDGGKLWDRCKPHAEQINLVDNLRAITRAGRSCGMRIFHVPHKQWTPGMLTSCKHPTPYQVAVEKMQPFVKGTWGAQFHPDFQVQPGDILVGEHWASSGFANTDLDYQLKQNSISKIICVGMVSNTCIEATARMGIETGYHVTLVRDATGTFSKEAMQAAFDIDAPTYAHEVLTTAELLSAFPNYGGLPDA